MVMTYFRVSVRLSPTNAEDDDEFQSVRQAESG